jgi:hypothetical protein
MSVSVVLNDILIRKSDNYKILNETIFNITVLHIVNKY